MAILLRFFTFLSLSSAVFALPATSVNEPELRRSLQRYQSLSQLDVDFKQLKTLKEMKRALESKGHLTVRPPDSVVYKITSPAALSVALTAKTITIESGSGPDSTKQVLDVASLKGSKEHRNLQAMVAWLQMDPHELASHYEITRTAEHSFHFVPQKADGAPFTALDLQLSSSGDVSRLVMHEPSGDQIEFQFGSPTIKRKK